MISGVNHVVGTFTITNETVIDIPNGQKVLFSVDQIVALLISINDDQHYMEYRNIDGFVEILNDYSNNLSKLYVKRRDGDTNEGKMRVWALIN